MLSQTRPGKLPAKGKTRFINGTKNIVHSETTTDFPNFFSCYSDEKNKRQVLKSLIGITDIEELAIHSQGRNRNCYNSSINGSYFDSGIPKIVPVEVI